MLTACGNKGYYVSFSRRAAVVEVQWPNLYLAYLKYGEYSPEHAAQLTRELLALPARPTALVVNGDVLMPGVLEAVAASALRVPEDIAILNYGDCEHSPCAFFRKRSDEEKRGHSCFLRSH